MIQPSPEDGAARERILVLLANGENRSLLRQLLDREFDVETDFRADLPAIDLCIVDGPSLQTYGATIRELRERSEPVTLPLLLLTDRRGVNLATHEVWRVVDDLLVRPVDKLELRARIMTLLRARRQSVSLAKLSALYEHERRVAQRFQEAAMPRTLPVIEGLRFSGYYRPGRDEAQIGGDWYDAVRLLDGRVVLTIGDVAGSGLNAAVMMASMRQVLRGVAHIHPDPTMMLDAADRTLQTEYPDRIVTAFVAVFDPTTLLLTYASAGHPRPLVRDFEGGLRELAAEGTPLGVGCETPRETRTIEVPKRSVLVLYTDGLTEATRDVIDGEHRLRGVLSDATVFESDNLAAAIHDAVLREGASDDVAVLAVEIIAEALTRRVVRWTFDATDAAEAKRTRDAFVSELRRYGVNDNDRSAAELVFGELIGNVVRYTPGPLEIVLDWSGRVPVLNVLDSGSGFRHVPKLPTDMLSERGRGLYIISSMTEEFHVSARPHGGSHARAVLKVTELSALPERALSVR